MKHLKHLLLTTALIIILFSLGNKVQGQVFWLGVNGGATYSWFSSPKSENVITGNGYGWNLGFFMKYGKRPFYKLGFYWTRAQTDLSVKYSNDLIIKDNVPFHKFDLMLKVGYEIIYKPKFKWHINAGPFIGTSFLFSSNKFDISRDDVQNLQWGLEGGTGIQFMNFIIDLDYYYNINHLFTEKEIDLELGSHMQHISLKVGFQF